MGVHIRLGHCRHYKVFLLYGLHNWLHFGAFFVAEAIDNKFLPTINHSFLHVSQFLAMEPLYQAFLFLRRGGSCISRMRVSQVIGSPSDMTCDTSSGAYKITSSEDSEVPAFPPALKLNLNRPFELCAMFFVFAEGVFRGFIPHPSLALLVQHFWEFGSLFSASQSLLMIQKRHRVRKALQ